MLGLFGCFYLFNALLIILQILHIFWFGMILRMVWDFLSKGQVMEERHNDSLPLVWSSVFRSATVDYLIRLMYDYSSNFSKIKVWICV